MKFTVAASLAALAAQQVAAHATFQQLWVGGTDYKSTCVRLPNSNSPVENVSSSNIRCNANRGPAAGKCPVAAGGTVTVEIHQQNGDRSCSSPAIGGQHWGPIIVYLAKVDDSAGAEPTSGWFKIFESGWAKAPGVTRSDDDYWGVKEIEECCGKMNVKIPSDIAAGDYMLRAEAIALHAASPGGGAQFYMSCFQLTVTGGGSARPAGVSFPGAYSASDPGIGLSIHGNLQSYTVPGPALYSGGTSKVPGPNAVCQGVEAGTAPGPDPTTTRGSQQTTTTRNQQQTTTTANQQPTTTPSNPNGCTTQKYGQCGGNGFTGCTNCASGSTCTGVSVPFYYQCL